MNLIVIAILLGLVEGLTEFLPVSSTGHLILAGHLLGFHGDLAKAFDVVIQIGAILAVVIAYRHKFLSLLSTAPAAGFNGRNGIPFLALSTLPAVGAGLLFHDWIKAHLFSPNTVAAALAVGAVWILIAERWTKTHPHGGFERMTWKTALGIGLFQCIALWPGMSRSTSTILGGMFLGLDRKAATEYSFFAAVPLLAAAGLYVLVKNLDLFTGDALPMLITGFAVSFLSAWAAIRFFIRFVSKYTLAVFAWYRLAVAALVFWLM